MANYNCILNLTFFVLIFFMLSMVMGVVKRGERTTGDHFGFDKTSNSLDYKIMDISISQTRTKQSVQNTLSLAVELDNGGVIQLNLELTDGLLANENTPVWDAVGKSFLSDNIMYTRNSQVMKEVGKFSFYQNYEHKAAAVLFHKYNIVEGTIGYFTFKKNIESIKTLARSNLKNEQRSNQSQSSEKPNVVYPELFIMLDRNYVRNGTRDALQKALLYWNNVDMLYSGIKSPEIKITIAGIAIPMNDYATPWIYKAKRNNGSYIHPYDVLLALDNHFFKHKREFSDLNYDIVVGLVSEEMHRTNGEKDLIGISFHHINCEEPRSRAVIATYVNNSYRSGAHGIAHLFSALDSEETKTCKEFGGIMMKNPTVKTSAANLLWSQCVRDSFFNYFNQNTSQCLRNVAKTMQDRQENTITQVSKKDFISNKINHQVDNKENRPPTNNGCSIHKSMEEVLLYSLFISLYLFSLSSFYT